MGTMSVPSSTLCLTLEVIDGDICFLDRKRLEPKSYYGNNTEGVICFFSDGHLMVPSFKNTALIFPEISFVHHLQLFSCRIMTSSLI